MTSKQNHPEVWLRGPIDKISGYLQPAAHALLQTREEVSIWLKDFPEEKLWVRPNGRANVGFHLQHITGVLDRMITYAKGEKLSESQFNYLKAEGIEVKDLNCVVLQQNFKDKVDEALYFFESIDENTLLENRVVGRKELPSTVLGLLFHAAEHSQRHLGQLIVTISFLK